MSSIIIDSLFLEGFRGFLRPTAVPFGSGFTVITGRNGSGKSTIIDAIEFSLTGVLSRNAEDKERRESIADYVWWRGEGQPDNKLVKLVLKSSDGMPVVTTRSPETKPETQAIEALMDTSVAPNDPIDTFLITTIIRDETIAKLSMDLNAAQRYEFIKRAIGLGESLELEAIAKALKGTCSQTIQHLERTYSTLRERLSLTTTQLSEARASADAISKTNIDAVRNKMRAFVQEPEESITGLLAQANAELSQCRQRIDEYERLRASTALLERMSRDFEATGGDQRLMQLAESLKSAQAALTKAEQRRDVLQEALKKAAAGSHRGDVLSRLIAAGSAYGLASGHCPLCGSRVAESRFLSHIKSIGHRLAIDTEALRTTELELESIEQQYAASSANVEQLRHNYEDLMKVKDQIAATKLSIELEQTRLRLTAAPNLLQSISTEMEKVQQLDQILLSLRSFNALDAMVRLERELQDLRGKELVASQELTNARDVSRLLDDVHDASRRASAEIVEDRISSMLPLLKELYIRLRPHVRWQHLELRIGGDVKGFLSFSVGQDVNPRFVYSSGQRRALGLAFLLGVHLGRRWSKLNTLILDDPVQHIDDYRALHLVEVLSAIRQFGRQIICAVEDSAIADLLCRRLQGENDVGRRLDLTFNATEGVQITACESIERLPPRALLSA